MMKAITLGSIPSLEELLDDPYPCGDTEVIVAYLNEVHGWPYEVGVEQARHYRLESRGEFYESRQEDDPVDIDPCVQAWIYTPMEVYLITKL